MKKTLSLILCLLMLLSMGSTLVFADTPVEISTAEQLDDIRNNLNGNYVLTADIVIPDSAYQDGGIFADGFLPIGLTKITSGANNDPNYVPTAFTGTLDGAGHTIAGIRISMTADNEIPLENMGLLAYNTGNVKNLVLDSFTFEMNYPAPTDYAAKINIGALASLNGGTVQNCAVTNAAFTLHTQGELIQYVGGIIGQSTGVVQNCYFDGTIACTNNNNEKIYAGGIIGYNNGDGYVNGTGGSIISCLSVGTVSAATTAEASSYMRAGDIVGLNAHVLNYAYAKKVNTSTIGTNSTSTQLKNTNKHFALEPDALAIKDSYTDFDFETIWVMEAAAPILRIAHTHTPDDELITDNAPTCSESGTGHYMCLYCDEIAESTVIPATEEHIKDPNLVIDKPDVCGSPGYGHYVCINCGTTMQSNIYYYDKTAHNLSDIIVVTPATCNKYGSGYVECLDCEHTIYLVILDDLPEHNGEWVVVTPATDDQDGLKEKQCIECGTVLDSKVILANNKLPKFTDVKKSDFFYNAVQWAVSEGVTAGTSKTTFGPNEACTRAQAVTFLWRAAGSPAPKSSNNPFKDVKKSDYYYKAVLWAVENNITAGTSKTTFSPDEVCTREQIVTFLWRANGGDKVKASNPFTDVKKSDYYYNAVLWAVKNGVTAGATKTTFAPGDNCTRGQIVTFLYRAIV